MPGPAASSGDSAAGKAGDAPRSDSPDQRLTPEGPEAQAAEGITLELVRANPELSSFITAADRVMEGLGYTEHGFRHANLTASIAYQVLSRLEFGEQTAALGCVAGYLHDAGNMVSREMHGQLGAILVYETLRGEVAAQDLARIVAAIANHEEPGGAYISAEAAAVILADKADVHRSRVRKSGRVDADIHDRVNRAAEASFLRVDSDARTITLELTIDQRISQVMEYFEIFLGRMQMCRLAAEQLGCRFKLTVNGAELA